MIIGLDFDNTLVIYDELFAKVAKEQGVGNNEALNDKITIRNYLRSTNQEELFTKIQGEVYGKRITEARKKHGQYLDNIESKGIKLNIISHKTKTPYKGTTVRFT